MKEEVSFMDRQVAPVWSPSRAAMERKAKRTSRFYSNMNLWPFVGLLLALLIMFMGAPVGHPFVAVDLPGSFFATAQPKAAREDAMKVHITRDGRVYFRTQQVQLKSLPILIRGAVGEGAEKKVYLAVDSRAKYRDAAAVLGQIGDAGIRDISFLAYKREK